ncbi:MarR family winged helix-turn-helix transcriptional regulator [Corynebacterium glyciniphilum]|uniref:MarR family winged helix-turn-helix transcriptional regulator n=1 Tax=Corynebacterium glyciniphilum TaxID=1404244 RepID=UPI00265064C0|nr:MarR family transcriptional regulator [Corynebacterium glyciniphilum]MDN5684270.1 MarR family transcriptional regulator [Corynebacterium glyciniphilum]MDN6705791.1 MarR family transcriptional regulator [Corynebacterium glyciniphilum]
MTATPSEVAKRLRPVVTRMYLLYFRQTTQSSISTAQLSIMMNLQTHGALRISQIADLESIRMPTASNAINHLESLGLVSRVRDVSDRRGVRVKLTDLGKTELTRIGEERDKQMADILAVLDSEQLEKVEEFIPTLETGMEVFDSRRMGEK